MLRFAISAMLLTLAVAAWAGPDPRPTAAHAGPSHYLKTWGRIEKIDAHARRIYIRQDTRLLVFSANTRLCTEYRQKTNRKVTAYYLKKASGELVLKKLRL